MTADRPDAANPADEFQDPLEDYDLKPYDDPLQEALDQLPVQVVDATPFEVVSPETPTAEVLATMARLNIGSVLVTEKDLLLGIFTERDILERVAEHYDELAGRPIRDLMTPEPSFVYGSDTLGTALSAMAVSGHRHVPVLDLDGTVLGLVSPRRIARFLLARVGEG